MKLTASAAAAVFCCLVLVTVVSRTPRVTASAGFDGQTYLSVNVTPTPILLVESVLTKDIVRCARVPVTGLSRLKLGSYSSAHRLAVAPSPEIQERSYKKIQICLHRNSSLKLCQCENDNWENIQNEIWSSVISPYESVYIDVKFINNLSGSVTVSVKEEFQRWRLLCLAIGIILLLLAPIVSSWVPFYYSSSMAIGVCLVILILLFQGMKLFPTGRKNALYSGLSCLVLGAGTFLLNRLSTFVNSILVSFGIGEEMHNPVLVFSLVLVVLAGAAFGYWLVRKFVVDEDGTVDVGVAQFVKWALRIIAVTFIFQSTLDAPLAVVVLLSFWGIRIFFTSMSWHGFFGDFTYSGDVSIRGWGRERVKKSKGAEFLSRSRTRNSGGTLWRSPKNVQAWSNSPVKGIVSPPSRGGTGSVSPPSRGPMKELQNYYSTFHRTPDRKKFTQREWEDFTEEATRQSVAELTSSPEFTDWIINNADRIRLRPDDSSDDSMGSGSDSTDDKLAHSSIARGRHNIAGGFLWRR